MKIRLKRIAASLLAGLTCSLFLAGCREEPTGKLTMYMPDGAPAIAMSVLMSEDLGVGDVEYRVVTPNEIAATVTYKEEEKNADMCVLPLTDAAKHLGNGGRYTMVGSVTNGNLYLISKKQRVCYTRETLRELVGQKIGVLQLKNVPGLTFKALLTSLEIPWREIGVNDGAYAGTVNLFPITGADMVGVVEADAFLLAEPAVTVQAMKNQFALVGDLQELYGGSSRGYPQAVLVVKNSLLDTRPKWLKSYLKEVQRSCSEAYDLGGKQIVAAVNAHLADKNATTSLLPLTATLPMYEIVQRCGVRFFYAPLCKEKAKMYLSTLAKIDEEVKIPDENFYWDYEG